MSLKIEHRFQIPFELMFLNRVFSKEILTNLIHSVSFKSLVSDS